MNIFNSLGSNYDFRFVLESLFSIGNAKSAEKLKSYLSHKYPGRVILVYKGREAIRLALTLLGLPKGSKVAVTGYTCYAVYKAVIDAGCDVEYLDVDNLDLNFSPATLQAALQKNPSVKVLIIQNTLCYPCDVEKVVKICKQKGVILIEDLAHSAGTQYKNNLEAGLTGDLVTLSFSQDKIIDAISGGALIIKDPKYQNTSSVALTSTALRQQVIDRLYPLFTYLIRRTYQGGAGKLLHALLKKAGFLSLPLGNQNRDGLHSLPSWYCHLALLQFQKLSENIRHRQEIASIYVRNLNPKLLSGTLTQDILNSTNLRFPIFVKDRDRLVTYLKGQGIYVSDIWYDAPIAPKKYLGLTNYQHQCPEAERASSQILNLPTHRNVSPTQAKEIAERINQWLMLQ